MNIKKDHSENEFENEFPDLLTPFYFRCDYTVNRLFTSVFLYMFVDQLPFELVHQSMINDLL